MGFADEIFALCAGYREFGPLEADFAEIFALVA